MKIYISGKITGLPINKAKSNFWHTARRVESMYATEPAVHTINPFDINPLLGIKKYWFYMATDILKLIQCDAAYFMHNWKESRGAMIERKICELLNIEIIDGSRYEITPDFELEIQLYNVWKRIKLLQAKQQAELRTELKAEIIKELQIELQ